MGIVHRVYSLKGPHHKITSVSWHSWWDSCVRAELPCKVTCTHSSHGSPAKTALPCWSHQLRRLIICWQSSYCILNIWVVYKQYSWWATFVPYILRGWGWEGGIDLSNLENTMFEPNKKKTAFDQILTFFISVWNDPFVGICSKDKTTESGKK